MAVTVLVVDDSITVRSHVAGILAAAGFEVCEAVDGLEALAKLSESPAVALIVCDVNMPRLDGLGMLERLNQKGVRVPVIILTTEGQPDAILRAKSLGVKGWLVKPVRPDVLVAAAHKLTSAE